MTKINHKIISSGSKGNAVIINDMLFDAGVSYKKIEPYLYDIKYLFYTHRHGDHYKPATFKNIRKNFPRIKIIANYDLLNLQSSKNINHVVGDETEIKLKDRTIKSFKCVHDVPCSGYVVTYLDKTNFIYATDTNTLDYAPNIRYDALFLESNHDELKLKMALSSEKEYGYKVFENGIRHLSTKKSKTFYYLNRKDKNSKWVELHKSERFY